MCVCVILFVSGFVWFETVSRKDWWTVKGEGGGGGGEQIRSEACKDWWILC